MAFFTHVLCVHFRLSTVILSSVSPYATIAVLRSPSCSSEEPTLARRVTQVRSKSTNSLLIQERRFRRPTETLSWYQRRRMGASEAVGGDSNSGVEWIRRSSSVGEPRTKHRNMSVGFSYHVCRSTKISSFSAVTNSLVFSRLGLEPGRQQQITTCTRIHGHWWGRCKGAGFKGRAQFRCRSICTH
jgi:hypothetical protein